MQNLVNQYIELIKESKKEKTRQQNMKGLIERASYKRGIKKTVKSYTLPQAAMMGGVL